ncbi:helix-turn-helix domain-containing protein [Undibacterium squillarum]|uniref:HTH cro/C1-type domain-containing protein n=1 Tax=Undibacterium squillarum TaxID=1131567 RepID=A0ABQ2Y449_9BURK|nr:helix-turn-helix transcriptional regulator [Undibacterium squillarum]GGX53148.1 hypothetical protein GCM10010946_34670 [Undibacterium squillarum]
MQDMNTLKERLEEVMSELGMRKSSELASYCGVSASLVAQWFSGTTKLGSKPLKALAKTRFNIEWIADGTLPKYRAGAPAQVEALPVATPEVFLVYATKRELSLLSKFREATHSGMELIETTADVAEKDGRKIREVKRG